MKDWCKFFRDIEANPTKIVSRLKVREFLEAREHTKRCASCLESIERVLSQAPDENIEPNMN